MYKFDNKKRKASNVLNVLESIKLVIQIFISFIDYYNNDHKFHIINSTQRSR